MPVSDQERALDDFLGALGREKRDPASNRFLIARPD
jgi:hypothetical protein